MNTETTPSNLPEPHDPYQPPVAGPPPMPTNAGHSASAMQTTADDRSMAMLCHLLSIFAGIFGALIMWLVKRDQSEFINMHGKEAINFQLTAIIALIVSVLLMIVIIGFFTFLAVIVLMYVFPIIACIKANNGEPYRYPLTIRFLS